MMICGKIKHLIFDFGGVFMDLGDDHSGNPANLAKILSISEAKAAEIWKENRGNLLEGKKTPREFLSRLNKNLGVLIDVEESFETWKKLDKLKKNQINWDLFDYVISLKKKYKIHMFTNTIDLSDTSGWFNVIARHFDNVYKSFEIGYKKPSREAFLYVLERIDAKPGECVFIDDFQENIDTASRVGLRTVLYTSFGKLKKDLQSVIQYVKV